jgi:opacity protein-like surface antigen
LAHGEGFLDFAVGGSFTQNDDITFKAGGSSVTAEAGFDDSFATGVRGGYWFDRLPWLGVGAMVSYFEPDVNPDNDAGFDSERFAVIPLTALLMLRAPLLPSPAVPRGQLQLYLNVGPGAFITALDDDDYDYYGDDYDYDDRISVDIGLDVHAGATWMFTSRFGAFGEYRFTHYSADIDADSDDHGLDISLDSTLDTHHVMVGFAWHFD